MAIAQGTTITTSTNDGSSEEAVHTFSSQHTVDVGSNLLIVFTECWSSTTPHGVTGVTWGGEALTEAVSIQNDDDEEASIWYLINPDTGADDIVVTNSEDSEHQHIAANYSGVDVGGAVFSATNAVKGNSTNPTLDISSVTGELVIGCFGFWTPGGFAAGSGSTLIAFLDNNGSNDSVAADKGTRSIDCYP